MDAKDWIEKAVAEASRSSAVDSDRPTSSYLLRDENTGVAIREAVAEDAPALAAVGARAFQHAHASGIHPLDLAGDVASRFDESEMRRELDDATSRWLIALWHGQAVGLAQLDTTSAPNELPAIRSLQLCGLYVAPDWSGNGVGSALIEASSKLALEHDYESLWVRVWEGNRGAIAFFRSRSFVRAGYEILSFGRTAAPVVVLNRRLAPGGEE